MIIKFNPTIFKVADNDLRRILAKIIILIVEKKHFIDLTNLHDIFFDGEHYRFRNHIIAQKFFSDDDNETVERAFGAILRKSAYITQLHQNHLSRITIGQAAEEMHPEIAHRILDERSKVILENGINDWKFIKNVCEKYTSHKQRGSLYNLVKTAMISEHLEPENAGGHGEMVKVTTKWMENRYKDIALFKLMVLFDSDRSHKDGCNEIHKTKIAFLKNKMVITNDDYHNYESSDLIHWHILYKKKLENYVPLSILLEHIYTITEAQRIDLQLKTNDELDFIEYSKENIGLHKDKIKDQFPEMFAKESSYKKLEERCEHHKVTIELPNGTMIQVSELEQILLKIAKII